jgi:hypothetical protein
MACAHSFGETCSECEAAASPLVKGISADRMIELGVAPGIGVDNSDLVDEHDDEKERTIKRLEHVLETLSKRDDWTPRAFLRAHYGRSQGSIAKARALLNRLSSQGLLERRGGIIPSYRVTSELFRRLNQRG